MAYLGKALKKKTIIPLAHEVPETMTEKTRIPKRSPSTSGGAAQPVEVAVPAK